MRQNHTIRNITNIEILKKNKDEFRNGISKAQKARFSK